MLNKLQYQAGQLHDLLDDLRSRGANGSIHINTIVNSQQKLRTRIIVLKNGEIVFGGTEIPSNEEFAKKIGIKCNSHWADTAVKYAAQKLKNPSSFRELLEHIVRIRVFKWEEIEAAIQAQVVQVLEQTFSLPGELQFDSTIAIDLSYGTDGHGLNWYRLLQEIACRQKKWDALVPIVPSIEAIPQPLSNRGQTAINNNEQQHLLEWIDGRRSFVDIAEQLDQDPLELAHYYKVWVTSNSIVLKKDASQTQLTQVVPPLVAEERPIVLSVDDSPIVQMLIKRALVKSYQVLSSNNAVDALKLMNTNPIMLLLLDVTMPDVDGLEFCRTVRSIPKFKELPIIMVTARDKFSDKLRGQIAGTTYYLTKPFEPESLLNIVEKYVHNKSQNESTSYKYNEHSLTPQNQTRFTKDF